MDSDALKPILAGIVRHFLTSAGGALVAGGYIQSSDTSAFIGGGMVVAGIAWSWWQKEGQDEISALLKKMTATRTKADAVKVAEVLPPAAAVDTKVKAVSAESVVAKVLIAAFVLSLFLAGAPAFAQVKKQGPVLTGDLVNDAKNGFKGDPNAPNAVQLTGNLKKDAQAVWDKIVAASNADLKYASQLAANADTPASGTRKQCWDAILATNEQANGMNLKDASGNPIPVPDPKLFTQIEQAAEVLDALSPQGKLYTSCAGAAQLAQANVIQFISAAVTGVAGMAKLSPIPGL